MEQSPSWEANRFSASEEIPRILWNAKVNLLPHSPVPATCPYPKADQSFLLLEIHFNVVF
jgi:hypothetical protein